MRLKKNYKHISKDEFMEETLSVASEISDKVGSTMTAIGKFVGLSDGSISNDGADVVNDFTKIIMPGTVDENYITKLNLATSRTDQMAGDGTSATTVFTYGLLKGIGHNNQVNKTIKELKDTRYDMLKKLYELKIDFKTKEDYIKLATVSTKDDELGKLIGEAFYKGGKNALISMRRSYNGTDYVEVENSFVIPSSNRGLGLPEYLEDTHVVVIDGPVSQQTTFLNKAMSFAYSTGSKLMIVCTEIGEIAQKTIAAANEGNERGIITLIQVPNIAQSSNPRELLEDVASYVGAKIYKDVTFNSALTLETAVLGLVDTFNSTDEGTFLSMKKKTESTKFKIVELKKELKKLNDTSHVDAANDISRRINMLNGKTTYLYITSNNDSEFRTKHSRIKDAVISTQRSIDTGYVLGSGLAYLELTKDLDELNPFKIAAEEIQKKIFGISNTELFKYKYDGRGIVIDKHTGESKITDVVAAGIVDSANVVSQVIKNSVSIAIEMISVGTFTTNFEEPSSNQLPIEEDFYSKLRYNV